MRMMQVDDVQPPVAVVVDVDGEQVQADVEGNTMDTLRAEPSHSTPDVAKDEDVVVANAEAVAAVDGRGDACAGGPEKTSLHASIRQSLVDGLRLVTVRHRELVCW